MTDTQPAPVQPGVKAERTGATWADVVSRLVPDTRVVVMLGLFGLAYKILLMIETTPSLLSNAAFMIIVGAIVGGGGLGAVVGFLYGGTKSGADVMKAQSDAVIASSPPTDKGAGQ